MLVLDGGLVLYEHSYPPEDDAERAVSRLTPAGEHTFRLPDGETLRFELDADGQGDEDVPEVGLLPAEGGCQVGPGFRSREPTSRSL